MLIHKNIILLILIHLSSLSSHFITSETKTLEPHNNTTTTRSPWLAEKSGRMVGCRRRPWVCSLGDTPTARRLCCQNRCVEVTSDPNNCGLCRVRCPFTWQCCRGVCRNINFDPFHCGRCENRCQLPGLCAYGLCGYADPPLPFPPWRRRRPFPFPFPPRQGGQPPPVG